MTLTEKLKAKRNKNAFSGSFEDEAYKKCISLIHFADKLKGEEMVEKVAKALCYSEATKDQKPLPYNYSQNNWHHYVEAAKAALAVVRGMI